MSTEIGTSFSQKFTANVKLKLQQVPSRFRNAVMVETFTGSKAAQAVQQVGSTAAVKRTTRNADTPILNTPHDARWVYPEDYEWGDLIDQADKIKTLADFTSPYVQTATAALNRGLDDEVVAAFFSDTTKTGETGGTTTDWTTFVAANGGHQIAAGGVGMTVSKLRQAVKALRAAEVDLDMDPIYCALTAEEIDDLFTETQMISLDYNTNAVLVSGKLQPFMGVNFVHSQRLGTSGANRRIPVWAKSGMCLGVWQDIKGEVSKRADKSFATQVYASMSCGATRLEEKKIVEVLCA